MSYATNKLVGQPDASTLAHMLNKFTASDDQSNLKIFSKFPQQLHEIQ